MAKVIIYESGSLNDMPKETPQRGKKSGSMWDKMLGAVADGKPQSTKFGTVEDSNRIYSGISQQIRDKHLQQKIIRDKERIWVMTLADYHKKYPKN